MKAAAGRKKREKEKEEGRKKGHPGLFLPIILSHSPKKKKGTSRFISARGGYQLLAGGAVGFQVGRYDHTRALTIDPDLGAPPHAVAQEATTNEDAPVNLYWLTYNDTSDDLSTITLTGVTQGAHGATVLNADGTVTYTPALHWSGSDTFTYTISNGEGTATANVAVTVNPVDYPGVANAVNVATNQNTPVVVTLSGTDVEGSPLTYVIAQGPGKGTLGPVGGVSGNQVTYYPGGNASGTDTFTYQADDGQGQGLGAAATVTITVNAVAQSSGVTITPNGGPLALTEPSLQAPNSGSYTVVLNTQPSANVTVTPSTDQSQLQVTPATLTFTPQNWSVAQTVTVQAADDFIAQVDHTVTITHAAASADANYNNISIPGIPVAVTDGDFAAIAPYPAGGTQVDLNELGPTSAPYLVRLTSQPTANVTVTLAPDSRVSLSTSTLIFTPANWNTDQTVTLTLNPETVADGYHQTTVTLTAASGDASYQGSTTTISANIIDKDGPSALPDVGTTDENTAGTFNVLANDVSPQGYVLAVTAVTQPTHGAVAINADGTVTYTPQTGWFGSDSFGYTLGDGNSGSDRATVAVTVNEVDVQAPTVTNPGSLRSAEDDKVSLQIVATDTDESGFLYQATGLPAGLVMDAMTGRIWGWIDPLAHRPNNGTYTPSVTVDDLTGNVATMSFTWTVTHTNHPPHITGVGDEVALLGAVMQPVGFVATDIDGDPMSFNVNGLPPGLSYDPVQNLVSGTPTTAGAYTVNVTVADGQGGADANRFVWQVMASSIPFARVGFNPNGNVTLLQPATPLQGLLYFGDPADRFTPYDVTLVVTPAGRATIDTPLITLQDGQSATFNIIPQAISQKVEDVTIQAFVDGRETGRVQFTIAGLVLPDTVRAADTPRNMRNRISEGTGNWGSYNGAFQVTPNLLGVYTPTVSVARPQADDKYGNATVDAADVTRLSMATHGVVKVIGTVQTAPSLGADGLPDGLARNADNLWLEAGVGFVSLKMTNVFAVAATPIAVMVTDAKILGVNDINDPGYTKWFWGVKYTVEFKTDGGSLDHVKITEAMVRKDATGFWKNIKDDPYGWNFPTNIFDWVGLTVDAVKYPTRAGAIKVTYPYFVNPDPKVSGAMHREQLVRFADLNVDGEPKSLSAGHIIPMSGFYLTYKNPGTTFPNGLAQLLVDRTAMANNGAVAGILYEKAKGEKEIGI